MSKFNTKPINLITIKLYRRFPFYIHQNFKYNLITILSNGEKETSSEVISYFNLETKSNKDDRNEPSPPSFQSSAIRILWNIGLTKFLENDGTENMCHWQFFALFQKM